MNPIAEVEPMTGNMNGKRGGFIMGNERGVALVVAVLVMITATFLGIAAVMTSDIEIRISGNQRCSEKAFYAADAGIDSGLAWLLALGPAPPDSSSLPTMDKTQHVFDPQNDPTCYSRYRITDVNYTAPPPPGWELTMFEKRYYWVNSIGAGPANAIKEIEVIASYVFPK
jgi:Tfp pilus assembly protein PilX